MAIPGGARATSFPNHLASGRSRARAEKAPSISRLVHHVSATVRRGRGTIAPANASLMVAQTVVSVGPYALIIRRPRDQRATRSGAHNSPPTSRPTNPRLSGKSATTTGGNKMCTRSGGSRASKPQLARYRALPIILPCPEPHAATACNRHIEPAALQPNPLAHGSAPRKSARDRAAAAPADQPSPAIKFGFIAHEYGRTNPISTFRSKASRLRVSCGLESS